VISAAGSYRLASDLEVPDANTSAISVAADVHDVSLDLGGHGIGGAVSCSGTPVLCRPSTGTGVGIDARSSERFAVHDGVVSGMGSTGVWLGPRSIARELRVAENGGDGLSVGSGSVISGCTAVANGDTGVSGGSFMAIEAVTAAGNGASGVFGGAGNAIVSSVAADNGAVGLNLNIGSVTIDTAALSNQLFGIVTFAGVVARTAAHSNGTDGVWAELDSAVRDCVARNNGLLGLDGTNAYRGCVLSNNTGGTASAAGVQTGANLCDGSTTCP
jgi:hypothetical protein